MKLSWQSYEDCLCYVTSLFEVKEHLRKYPDYTVPSLRELQQEYDSKFEDFKVGHYYCKREYEPLLFFYGTHYSAYVPVKSHTSAYPFYVRLLKTKVPL